ncbi:MAG: TonB-dependent receptor [Bacteroidota bacterium]
MAHRYLLFVFLLLFNGVLTFAGVITGKVTDASDKPLPGATLKLQNTNKGAITDSKGIFRINGVTAGNYVLEVSRLGYKLITQTISVEASQTLSVTFSLEEEATELDEVVITEKSESRRMSENPIQISSIDVVKLQNETAGVVSVLDRTAGVRVRQSGGLGSNTTIQLNGLTGLAVRTYLDGIPMELFGGSIQLNNIPVNTVERVDIYKGVMPVDVGTDALAGGINVITRQVDRDFLDVSYQVGSFNTHVGTLNATKKWGKHVIVGLSGFYNYSDNNYLIRANQRTANFKEEEVEAERFHSAHQSSMISGSIGLVDVPWADKFAYSLNYNQRYDEIQHGVRIGNRAVGEANLEQDALIQTLTYQKKLFDNKFTIGYFGNFSISNENVDDSTTNVYNWFGEVVGFDSQGKEVLGLPSLREGRTTSHVHRLNLAYEFIPNHTLKVSSFLSDQTVKGSDPLAPRIGDVDPNTIPSFLTRSISGLSYESKLFDERLESILFGKYYFFNQSTADFRPTGRNQIFEFEAEDGSFGYGAGLKFLVKEDFFVRTSFEEAIRIPTKDEVFGNFLTIEPNFFLKPEESRNLNIGLYYKHNFTEYQYVSLDANWFLRDQSNLIRLEPGRNENDPAQFINEAEAEASGWEVTLQASPLRDLSLTASMTLQEIIRGGEPTVGNTNGVGTAIPNIPTTFYNVSGRYTFDSPFSKEDNFSVFGYYRFVDEFDFIFQTTRNIENIIPTQRQVDIGITYMWSQPGLTFSLQADNLLDEEVFDNFRVPRPGRYISFKIRYLFQRT